MNGSMVNAYLLIADFVVFYINKLKMLRFAWGSLQ